MFGEIVRAYRLRMGLSQEELAERAGMSARSVGNIENDRISRPRPATVRLLADAFELTGTDRDRFCQLARTEPDTTRVPGRLAPPAQLPADIPGFVGRDDHLRRLTSLLDQGQESTAVVISAVCGTAGVGKTALAVHWAHRVADRFPDGQLYVNLRGFDPAEQPVSQRRAIRGFLDALGVPPELIPPGVDAQTALYRSLVANRRVLVVLDNARDSAQVRPLLPGSAGCLALVTSRNRLSGLVAAQGAQHVPLDLLSTEEARQLLVGRLGPNRIGAEPEATEEIIARCARLPLALAIVAAVVGTSPGTMLGAVAAGLSGACGPFELLASDDPATNVRTVFSWSLRALSPAGTHLFRLLGLHPGPEISTLAAASLAAVPVPAARTALDELVRASLVVEAASGRFVLHDLLRAYADEQAGVHESESDRREAAARLLDHLLHTGWLAARLLEPNRPPIELGSPRPGTVIGALADRREALAWFTAEHHVLLAEIGRAEQLRFDAHAWQLAWTVSTFLARGGHWEDWATSQRTALAAASRLGDRSAEALAHRLLARAHVQASRFEDAEPHLRRSLELSEEIGDLAGQARVHVDLGVARRRQNLLPAAIEHARLALNLYARAHDEGGQASALNNMGFYHALLGDYRSALAACERALALHRRLDNSSGEAHTWDSLGYIHHRLGSYARAVACYRRAAGLFKELGSRYDRADTLNRLGDAHRAADRPAAARAAWRRALNLFDDIGHPELERVRLKLRDLDGVEQVRSEARP